MVGAARLPVGEPQVVWPVNDSVTRGQTTAPKNSTQLIGTRYFRQVIIT